jgi:predicted Zn finger-like uncharacterized protein
MVITCYSCSTSFNLKESLLKPEGTKVRCSRCRHFFKVYPPVHEIINESEDFSDPDLDAGITLVMEDDEPAAESDENKFIPEVKPFKNKKIHTPDQREAIASETENNIPGLELDESEFDYLELAGLEIDADLGIEDDAPTVTFPRNQTDPEFGKDENELEAIDEDVPELELEIDTSGLGLDDHEMDEEVLDSLDFDTLTNNLEQPSVQVSVLDDDPEFELEFNTEPEPAEKGSKRPEPQYASDKFAAVGKNEFSRNGEALEEDTDAEMSLLEGREVTEDEYPKNDDKGPAPLKIGRTWLQKSYPEGLDINGGAAMEKIKSIFKNPAVILILFLVIIGGACIASLMAGYRIPILSNINIPFLNQIPKKEPPPKTPLAPIPNQKNLDAKYVDNSIAGKLFVITGSVENPSTFSYSHIQVKGELISKDGVAVKTGFAFCGNIVPDEILKTGKLADINTALSEKNGTHVSNVNIKPGASVPYMLIFSNLQDQLKTFTVQVNTFDKD